MRALGGCRQELSRNSIGGGLSGTMRIQLDPLTDKYQVRDWNVYFQWLVITLSIMKVRVSGDGSELSKTIPCMATVHNFQVIF